MRADICDLGSAGVGSGDRYEVALIFGGKFQNKYRGCRKRGSKRDNRNQIRSSLGVDSQGVDRDGIYMRIGLLSG